jgi:predicted DNA-binding protein
MYSNELINFLNLLIFNTPKNIKEVMKEIIDKLIDEMTYLQL